MCDCYKQMDEALKEANTKLTPAWLQRKGVITQVMTIATEKVDSRKRQGPVKLLVAFCPFCGEMIEQGSADAVPSVQG